MPAAVKEVYLSDLIEAHIAKNKRKMRLKTPPVRNSLKKLIDALRTAVPAAQVTLEAPTVLLKCVFFHDTDAETNIRELAKYLSDVFAHLSDLLHPEKEPYEYIAELLESLNGAKGTLLSLNQELEESDESEDCLRCIEIVRDALESFDPAFQEYTDFPIIEEKK